MRFYFIPAGQQEQRNTIIYWLKWNKVSQTNFVFCGSQSHSWRHKLLRHIALSNKTFALNYSVIHWFGLACVMLDKFNSQQVVLTRSVGRSRCLLFVLLLQYHTFLHLENITSTLRKFLFPLQVLESYSLNNHIKTIQKRKPLTNHWNKFSVSHCFNTNYIAATTPIILKFLRFQQFSNLRKIPQFP